MKIENIIEVNSGTPQFRIKESLIDTAPEYKIYDQKNLEADLIDEENKMTEKVVRTEDNVDVLKGNDVIFSLISGKAAIVKKRHEGYMYTKNFVTITPLGNLDFRYLVYLLNEDNDIKRQLNSGLQGTSVMKYTVNQLKNLRIKNIPNIDVQKSIGLIYLNQLRVNFLENRLAENKTLLIMEKLKGIN